jgi:hypothetical protein
MIESAEKPILSYPKNIFSSEQPSLSADGDTIMSLPCFTKGNRLFWTKQSPSSTLDVYGSTPQHRNHTPRS